MSMMWNDRSMWDFDEPKQPAPPEDHYKGYDLNYKLYMDPRSVDTELIGTIKHVKTNNVINIKLSVKQDAQSLMDTCLNFYKTARGLIDLFEAVKDEEVSDEISRWQTNLAITPLQVEEENDSSVFEELTDLEEDEEEEVEEEVQDTSPTFDSLNSWFDQTDTNRWLNK